MASIVLTIFMNTALTTVNGKKCCAQDSEVGHHQHLDIAIQQLSMKTACMFSADMMVTIETISTALTLEQMLGAK